MKKINLIAIAVTMMTSVFFTSCSKENVSPDNQAQLNEQSNARRTANNIVQIMSDHFDPRVLELVSGETVTWVNNTRMVQAIAADDESFSSGDIQPGQAFSVVITKPGTTYYHSKYNSAMVGVLQVAGIK